MCRAPHVCAGSRHTLPTHHRLISFTVPMAKGVPRLTGRDPSLQVCNGRLSIAGPDGIRVADVRCDSIPNLTGHRVGSTREFAQFIRLTAGST